MDDDPLLQALHFVFLILGLAIIYVGRRLLKRRHDVASVPAIVTLLVGFLFMFAGVSGFPGRTLKLIKALAQNDLSAAYVQETPEDDLALLIESELVTQTPVEVPVATPESTLVPAPEPEPTKKPAPKPPERERTLPVESENPVCTRFVLIHGASGGPEPEGCFAVGCAEGYALPMHLNKINWISCPSYARLERKGDCYFVHDADGSERAMRFRKGEWKLAKKCK